MSERDKSVRVFEVLVQEHAPMLVSFLSSLTGSEEEAHDLAQETFLRAYQNFDRFGGKGMNFAGWVRTIGRNLFIDRHRARKAALVNDPSLLEGIEDVFRAADEFGSGDSWTDRIRPLKECLERLSDRARSACDLHYFKGMKAQTIAGQLGVDLNAVLKRLERARTFLRECIEHKLGLGGRESHA